MALRTGSQEAASRKRKDNKISWRRKWLGFGVIAVGLGLALGGLRALVTPNVPSDLQQGLILLIFLVTGTVIVILGLLALLLGWLVLRGQKIEIRHLRWIDWVLLLLVSGMVACIPSLLSPLPSLLAVSADVKLPIPAKSLTGGTGPLYPGAVVEIVASVPDASGTPVPDTYTDLEVLGLLDMEGEKGTVLVAVPPERAEDLQRALIKESAKFTYRLLPGTPTPTPAPEEAPTPTPTPIPVVFSLEATRIPSDLNTLSGTDRVAVILVVASIDDESKALTHKAHHYDAELIGAYDSSGNRLPVEKEGTPIPSPYATVDSLQVSLPLSSEGSVQFAAHLADADQLYVIPLPTLTPTPTPTSTLTPTPSGGG